MVPYALVTLQKFSQTAMISKESEKSNVCHTLKTDKPASLAINAFRRMFTFQAAITLCRKRNFSSSDQIQEKTWNYRKSSSVIL